MITKKSKVPGLFISAAVVAAGMVGAAGAAYPTGPRLTDERVVLLNTTAAEQAFPDASDGVDPMVTGPTSASFKQRQSASLCAEAVWPNIPLDCYPGR
jgi:hypothetical protein